MKSFKIYGGKSLKGEIEPKGAKNEALQTIAATLLTDQPVVINNVPHIEDVLSLINILNLLGVDVNKIGENSYEFCAKNVDYSKITTNEFKFLARKLRGSILLAGPLLARFNKCIVYHPGGDKIGRRRLDTHFNAFQKLGISYQIDLNNNCYYLEAKQLVGNYILLEEASLTGTANIIMASVLAKGKTTIYNAACEPYIQQLCKMLNSMGARISGYGTNLITIEGVDSLCGCQHTILPDMIEVGSFIGLSALTNSNIRILNVCYPQLGIIPEIFRKLGINLKVENDDIIIEPQDVYEISKFMDGSILTIYDAPWPGFSSDLLSIALVTATQARGSVLIHQKMFESRLFFVDKLIDMGAQIILCDPHRAIVIGLERKYPLRGIEMSSPDIRAGVTMLIAALSAEGLSIIHNVEQIDRGYEKIDERLRSLGANIERIQA